MQPSPADVRAAHRRRELNLAIVQISKERGLARPLAIACECGHPQCWETVAMEVDAFDALVAAGQAAVSLSHPLTEPGVAAGESARIAVS